MAKVVSFHDFQLLFSGTTTSILAVIKYMWIDKALRLMSLVVTAVNFLFICPLLVGIPVLADQRLPEGAGAFGLLMSAYANGNLVGYLVAGSLPRSSAKAMLVFIIVLQAVFILVLGSFGFFRSTWVDFTLLLMFRQGNGYFAITVFTWSQLYTPKAMLG